MKKMKKYHRYPERNVALSECVIMGLAWGVLHMSLEGIAVFLCTTGVGKRALSFSLKVSGDVTHMHLTLTSPSCKCYSMLHESMNVYYAPRGIFLL